MARVMKGAKTLGGRAGIDYVMEIEGFFFFFPDIPLIGISTCHPNVHNAVSNGIVGDCQRCSDQTGIGRPATGLRPVCDAEFRVGNVVIMIHVKGGRRQLRSVIGDFAC